MTRPSSVRPWLPLITYAGLPILAILLARFFVHIPADWLLLGSYGTGIIWAMWGFSALWDAWTRLGPPKWKLQWEYNLGGALLTVAFGFVLGAYNIGLHPKIQPDWFVVYTWVRAISSGVAFAQWSFSRFGSGGPHPLNSPLVTPMKDELVEIRPGG